MEFFQNLAECWHEIFGGVQDCLMPAWLWLLELPVIGTILSFLETTFGRGATPLG
ncbi:MAG: hypothetical protein FWH26_10765 [Oscillospiraceae bacterium]|nr:hypothetical protein [Oscillospiraceae bacterium]